RNSQIDYDLLVTELAERFLRNKIRESKNSNGEPWLLYCGYINPHFPLIAPKELFDLYYNDDLPLPATRNEPAASQHPALRRLRHWLRQDEALPDDLTRKALASYYGLITFTDQLIGRLIDLVDSGPLAENTVVIYTSDHGEMGGNHGMWQKQCFYEQSVRVPLIMRMPEKLAEQNGIAAGMRIRENVSLVDIAPTLLELSGCREPSYVEDAFNGESLLKVARDGGYGRRAVFSEHHAMGAVSGRFMVKKGNLKYNYYVGEGPELFDLAADPDEVHDLAKAGENEEAMKDMHSELLKICDPDYVDNCAKENQQVEGAARGYIRGHNGHRLFRKGRPR
ncbi:MAG: sulfatase-like hydrolase/transferase, partial [Spirochaetales bacterium]|nr:sulfatase-like hydrolase/transferase [Spirochaetales bacterium]